MVRVLSGVTLAAVFLAVIWYATPLLLLLVALAVGALAFTEYARMAAAIGAPVPRAASLAATLIALAMVPCPWVETESVLGVALIVVAAIVMARRPPPGSLASVAAGLLAPIYIGLPLGALVSVHAVAGREAVLLLLATVVVSDTAQYYTGRTLGRRPLAARLSPKKTLEGAIGGLVVAPAFFVAAGAVWLPGPGPATLAVAGLGIAAAGIAGDLFESMLKRAADIKDSSTLIPGHGGVLDRIDALLFATPVFLLFLRLT
ncbi:MAG: phosphatidate cytidylyltransferase [Acidobacteriota bacterium]